MHFGWMDLYARSGWPQATPHTDQDGKGERQIKGKTGSGTETQTTEEDSYKPWSDFGGRRPPPSCHFSCMQWDGEPPSLKEDKSPPQQRKKKEDNRKKEKKSTKFRSFWNSKEENENYCGDFSMKKCVYLIVESIKRNSPGSCPNPSVETISYRERPTTKRTRTRAHTHTSEHVNSEAAETPRTKTAKLAHSQQRMKQFYRNQKSKE